MLLEQQPEKRSDKKDLYELKESFTSVINSMDRLSKQQKAIVERVEEVTAEESGPVLRKKEAESKRVGEKVEEQLARRGFYDKIELMEQRFQQNDIDFQQRCTHFLEEMRKKYLMDHSDASRAGGGGSDSVVLHELNSNRKLVIQLQEEVVMLRSMAVKVQEDFNDQKQAVFEQVNHTLDQERKKAADDLSKLWEERDQINAEVEKIASTLKESLTFLNSNAKNKEDMTRNQVLNQCYSMQAIHQNEFRILVRKLDEMKHDDKIDKSGMTADIEKAASMCNKLFSSFAEQDQKLVIAKQNLAEAIERNRDLVVSRMNEMERAVKSVVEDSEMGIRKDTSELKVYCENVEKRIGDVEKEYEKGTLGIWFHIFVVIFC